jgi:hypothetical protein
VQKGFETIDAVKAAWGVGPAAIAIWTDPTDDGNPADAVLAMVLEDVPLSIPEGSLLRTIAVPPTYVGEAGESFYVGLKVLTVVQLPQKLGEFPAWFDTTPPNHPMQSWAGFVLEDLSEAFPIESQVFPGNWLIRAAVQVNHDLNGNSIPDDCVMSRRPHPNRSARWPRRSR